MATSAPIAWDSCKLNMHYKSVLPIHTDTGMQVNLHRNVTKRLLPREIREDVQSLESAKKILYRQRMYMKLFSGGQKMSSKQDIISLSQRLYSPRRSPRDKTQNNDLRLPPVSMSLPNTPNTRYTKGDVLKIVERLSTYDPEKVPESRGYHVKLPTPIVYKKKYTEDEIQGIVKRLSEFDMERKPADSKRLNPTVVSVLPRQSMIRVKKCTAEQVHEIVDRLSKYDVTKWPPESRAHTVL